MPQGPTVITIGNFDGVHLGHAALVRAARLAAGPQGLVLALAFDPHPMTRLNPGRAPQRIGSFERRAELLRAAGADRVDRLEPTDQLLGLSARQFIEGLVARHGPAAFVEGPDFHFGKARGGNTRFLADLGPELGFRVVVVPPVEVALTDGSVVTASSTITRWLLRHGRVRDAAAVLGRPHEVAGVVVRGDRLGRTIGFPTANTRTDDLIPMDGVYAGLAHLPDGRRLAAAISVGTRPTFDGSDRRLEPFLLDAPAGPAGAIAGLPEYDWPIRIEFRSFIREQMKFESIGVLCRQMARDVDRVRAVLAGPHTAPRAAGASTA